MASSLRVNAIVPASGTNVAIGTAGGTITYNANVSGVSTFSSGIVVSVGSTEALRTDSNSNIGIKTTSTSGFNGACDDVIISGSADVGLTFHSTSTTGTGSIAFTDTVGSSTQGAINYFHNGDYMIFQTGASERMRIDSSGRVTKSLQPSFCASKSNTEQTTSGTIVFNSDSGAGRHNIGGHYSTSTGTFTAPIAGRYVFMCSIHSTNGTYRVDVRLRINGNDAPGGFALNNIDAYTQATGCAVLNLAANDAVTIYNNNAGVWYDAGLTYFSGYLLG